MPAACLAWVVRYPRWATLGLPLLTRPYARAWDVPALPARAGPTGAQAIGVITRS
jgi:hypothetical protein